jgi:predicted dehydrogenase
VKRINWGILSTGRIAGIFAEGVLKSKTGRLAAVGSRSRSSAQKFAQKYRIPKAHGSYEELLKDSSVDAVYIATPHPFHVEWVIKAAKAGKHILCEKPLGMNVSEAKRMVEAARKNKVFFMEAFMYRCHPQTAKIVQLIQSGLIGEVRLIEASFCFNNPVDSKHRLFNKKLGGGGILDIGCYPASFARLVAGAANKKLFLDPIQLKGFRHRGKTGVDEWAVATLKFKGDILAEISCATRAQKSNTAKICGSKGTLIIERPWFASWGPGKSQILFQKDWQFKPRPIWVKSDRGLYAIEADEVGRCLQKGLLQSPVMSWEDSLGNAKVLGDWLQQL